MVPCKSLGGKYCLRRLMGQQSVDWAELQKLRVRRLGI